MTHYNDNTIGNVKTLHIKNTIKYVSNENAI